MSIYPLGTLMEVIESVKGTLIPMKVAYAYEDLVFLEHNVFLLQFTDKENKVLLHKNVTAEKDTIESSIAALKSAAQGKNITIVEGSLYSIEQADDENVRINFLANDQR
nr:hypothetical protein [Desulfobulbaceae bacterium]